jgi:hypothetical protein
MHHEPGRHQPVSLLTTAYGKLLSKMLEVWISGTIAYRKARTSPLARQLSRGGRNRMR